MDKWGEMKGGKKISRVMFILVAALILFFLSLAITLNIPSVQTWIARKILNEIRAKTGTSLSIQAVKIAFPKTVQLSEVFARDKNGDTLVYLKSLKADIGLFKLLRNKISLNDIELSDAVININRKGKLEEFNYEFIVEKFFGNTNKTDTINKKIWLFDANTISLSNIRFLFLDEKSGIKTKVDLDKLEASINKLDFSKRIIGLDKLLLKNAGVKVAFSKSGEIPVNNSPVNVIPREQQTLATDSVNSVFFPNWNITSEKLLVQNSNVWYDDNNQPKMTLGFDYNHFAIRDLNGDLSVISVSADGISVVANSLNFNEPSGFKLNKLAGEVQFRRDFTGLLNLHVETPSGKIEGDAKIEYPNFHRMIDDFSNCNFIVDARVIRLKKEDILFFAPWLSENKYFNAIGPSGIVAVAKISGKLSNLTFEIPELSVFQQTNIKTHGRLAGLPDYHKLDFDVVVEKFSSGREDLSRVIDLSEYSGYKFPPIFSLSGKSAGKPGTISATAELTTSFGNISANAWYKEYVTARQDSFHLDFNAKEIMAGTIIGDSLVGKISASGNATGRGLLQGQLSGKAGLTFREAEYNSYKYSGIRLIGEYENQKVTVSANSDDLNLAFRLAANADLKEPVKQVAATLDLERLNLKELHFTASKVNIRTTMSAKAEYKDSASFTARLEGRNTMVSGENKQVPVKFIEAEAVSNPGNFKAQIKSDIVDGTLSGNVRLNQLSGIFRSAYRKYFGLPDSSPLKPGNYLAFQANFNQPQIILQQFIPGLDRLRIRKLAGEYTSSNNELTVNIDVPEILYYKVKVDSLQVTMNGKLDSISMDLALQNLFYDNIKSGKVAVHEQVKHRMVRSEIQIGGSPGKPLYLFANQVELFDNGYKIRFLPGGLILDGVQWSTPEDNYFQSKGGLITARNFEFTNKKASVSFFADELIRKFVFSGFEIKSLGNIIEYNGRRDLVNGIIDGELKVDKSNGMHNLNASFVISNLALLDSAAGNLSCKLGTKDDRLTIDTKIENQHNTIALEGNISNLSTVPILDLKGIIDIQNLGKMERFTFGQLSKMSGKIEGEVSVKGTQLKPDINGYLNFENTALKVNKINFLAKLNNQKVSINSSGFHFRDFVVEDALSKKLTINGDFFTDYHKDFKYDLHIVANDFQPVNSTYADNPLFFGKLAMDTDMKITGNLESPKIEADVKINSATNLTYVMPGSELKLVTSEGIVKFRDTSDVRDSLMLKSEGDYLADSIISKLTGIDLSMNLEIDPNAKFRLDIDPKSGDYLAISGSAKLNISLDVTGKQSVTGVYEVKEGNYQLSFYGMVKKNFTIMPGSTVTWSGRPMDADVNITAQYIVRTSSVALVANETSGMSEAERNVFKTRLPYEVKLIIRGFPNKPDIKFELALPDRYVATYPVVGSKVALLNTEERTSELNKQVFALLVTGGFIADNPMSTGDGTSPTGIASTAARNSVNGILADQLNNISGRFINAVDLNFGLTSYEDYGQSGSDTRTELDVQLSKKLFNDRLTFEAQGSFDLSGDKKNTGTSTEKSNGEVGVVYALSKNNEYKIRIYYQNIYDLFEGELTCSGIALIFEKELDSLRKSKKDKVKATTIKK